jgi:hypothetical protein
MRTKAGRIFRFGVVGASGAAALNTSNYAVSVAWVWRRVA